VLDVQVEAGEVARDQRVSDIVVVAVDGD